MQSKINRAAIEKLVAVLFTLAWLSQIPYLFPHPFQRHEGIAKFSEELVEIDDVFKESAGIQNKTAADIEKDLTLELRGMWIKSLLLIVAGIIIGLMSIKRKKLGYGLAMLLSSHPVSMQVRTVFSLRARLPEYFRVKFEHFPVQTGHEMVFIAVLLLTIVVLLSDFIIYRWRPVHRMKPV
jgi:hypothetical protein